MPSVVQCELTYINHFEEGREWHKSIGDVSGILSGWSGQFSGNFLPRPESVQLGASFLIPEGRGRLRINLEPALRLSDRKQILQLTLVARGTPISGDPEGISAWFDVGHEWIVRGFTDFTSVKMHELWKRRQ